MTLRQRHQPARPPERRTGRWRGGGRLGMQGTDYRSRIHGDTRNGRERRPARKSGATRPSPPRYTFPDRGGERQSPPARHNDQIGDSAASVASPGTSHQQATTASDNPRGPTLTEIRCATSARMPRCQRHNLCMPRRRYQRNGPGKAAQQGRLRGSTAYQHGPITTAFQHSTRLAE